MTCERVYSYYTNVFFLLFNKPILLANYNKIFQPLLVYAILRKNSINKGRLYRVKKQMKKNVKANEIVERKNKRRRK